MNAPARNPILPGFHPDPSLLRVGRDFYLATSTFEWWPGVRIHHSRDLVHWQHLSYALTRPSQLRMLGNPDSCGIWAPCLSHRDGTYYLVFTNVRSLAGAYKDCHNFVVTAPHPSGPWSEPIALNGCGFDPSFFHDDDGRTWLVAMQWDHRAGHDPFRGILLQEFDRRAERLVGTPRRIFTGSPLGLVEGPHLYKKDGWYLLMTAEGGTGFEHAVTVARSRTIDGPYELPARHPLLTAHRRSPAGLQRAGHASLVDTGNGRWALAHLCGRPIEWRHDAPADPPAHYGGLHCPLGRETALQEIAWTADGWPRLAHGGDAPSTTLPDWGLAPAPVPVRAPLDDFDDTVLAPDFNSLRAGADASWLSLDARRGWLRLHGRESLMSTFEQSLVARRQQAFDCEASTTLDFAPASFQQMAGLVAYYNTGNHAYLHVTHDEAVRGRVLRLSVNNDGALREPVAPVALPDGLVRLRMVFAGESFRFAWGAGEVGAWQDIGPALPASMLSDEHATRFDNGFARSFGFTGNFLGIACQDLTGARLHADFDHFTYLEAA